MCMRVCTHTGQRTASGLAPEEPFTLFETASLIGLWINLARLAGQRVLGPLVLHPSTGITHRHHHTWFSFLSNVSSGDGTQSPHTCVAMTLPM